MTITNSSRERKSKINALAEDVPDPMSRDAPAGDSGVKLGDVFRVAVVELRFDAVAGVNHPLGSLRPARVRHVRVHVGLERIFLRLQRFPKRFRLFGDELD